MKRLVGVQIIGKGDVSKRIDLAALLISKKGKVEDLLSVDLGYAPAFSNALGAIVVAANVLQNKLEGRFLGIPAKEALELLKHSKGHNCFIDVRNAPEFEEERIEGTISIPIENLQTNIEEIPRKKTVILISGTGARAYQGALILQAKGYRDVKILEGGLSMWPYRISHD